MTRPALKSLREIPAVVGYDVCQECVGRGLIKLLSPGKPHTTSMARCEQCSGFGKVSK